MRDESWQTRLMARHAGLFERSVQGRRVRSGFPAVEEGWRDLVETAVARIAAALAPSFTGAVTITEIKEKFGTLRIYTQSAWLPPGPRAKIEEAIDLAEARSACSCETCGAVGRLHDDHGWYTTCCDAHARGKPVPVRAGQENLLIKYAYTDGKLQVVSCRRYDRERDSFVDVPLPRKQRDGGV